MALKKRKTNIDGLLIKVAALLQRHQPASLSFSRISQLTGVPRATLYYYFGKSKDALLEQAAKVAMSSLTQLSENRRGRRKHASWKSFQRMRLKTVFSMARRYPWGPQLYLRYRNDAGRLGETIRDIELKYRLELSGAWKEHHGGQLPDERSFRLASYMKIGILWGVASDRDYWFSQVPKGTIAKVVDEVNDLSTRLMKLSF